MAENQTEEMNKLIATDVVGELSAVAIPSQKQAEKALKAAQLPETIDVSVIENRSIVGRYLAGKTAGNILASAEITKDEGLRLRRKLLSIVEEEMSTMPSEMEQLAALAANKIDAAKAWSSIVDTMIRSENLSLQAAEITTHGVKKSSKKTLAIQVNTTIVGAEVAEQPPNDGKEPITV